MYRRKPLSTTENDRVASAKYKTRSSTSERARRGTSESLGPRKISIPDQVQQLPGGTTLNLNGVRRSNRQSTEPLQYWRNEKRTFKRQGPGWVATAIYKVPQVEARPLSKVGKKPSTPRKRKLTQAPQSPSTEEEEDVIHGEELVLEGKHANAGKVLDFHSGNPEIRRLKYDAGEIVPSRMPGREYSIAHLFTVEDFMNSGMLELPPGCEKPCVNSGRCCLIFLVCRGAVEFTCHNNKPQSVGRDETFLIPRGKRYSITCISKTTAKLWFAFHQLVPEEAANRADEKEEEKQVEQDGPQSGHSLRVSAARRASIKELAGSRGMARIEEESEPDGEEEAESFED